MRSVLRSAALVASAATAGLVAAAVPSGAELPVAYCTVRLVAANNGDTSSCVAPFPGENGLIMRTLTLDVAAGRVTATTTCGANTRSVTVSAPYAGGFTVIQPRDVDCVHTLVSHAFGTTATGVSTYSVTHV